MSDLLNLRVVRAAEIKSIRDLLDIAREHGVTVINIPGMDRVHALSNSTLYGDTLARLIEMHCQPIDDMLTDDECRALGQIRRDIRSRSEP